MDPTQKDAITAGLSGLADWAAKLDQHGIAKQVLPVIGRSVGDALGIGDILGQGLAEPIVAYLLTANNPTTDDLVSALQALVGTSFDNVLVNVANVTGGLNTDPGTNELLFNFNFDADRSLMANVGLGPIGDALGIALSTQIGVDASLALDVSFGVDLTTGLSPEEAFFIRVSNFAAHLDAAAASLASGPMRLGFFGAALASGNMAMDADLDVSLANPDADPQGNITLAELQDTSLTSLVMLNGSGTASGSIIATLPILGTFTPIGTPTLSFSTSTPFVSPSLTTNAAYDQVRSFANVSSSSYIGMLAQLGNFLDGVSAGEVLDAAMELASNSRIGNLVPIAQILRKGLIDKLLNGEGLPTFNTAQELATELANALGLSAGTIAANYVPGTKELTYHIVVDHSFVDTSVPLGFKFDLEPVGGFTSSGDIAVNADGSLELTIGVDLSDPVASIVATTAAPVDGKISADASFTLQVGIGESVSVTLQQSATNNNNGRGDLVTDLDDALLAAGLSASVVAGIDNNNRLTLSTKPSPLGLTALELRAADYNPQGPPSDDPVVTQLGFRERQFAFDSLVNHAFVEGASIHGAASLSSSDIDAAANVGFAKVGIVNGTGNANAEFTLQLKNPTTQVAGGRVKLFELLSALATGVTTVVDAPTLEGELHVSLPIDATILGQHVSPMPVLVVDWDDISIGSPSVELINGAALEVFKNLTGTDFVIALVNLGVYLASLQDFSVFGVDIPALEKSLGKLAAYADRFQQFVANFQADPAASLDELETHLEEAFGLEPPELDLSLVDNGTVIRVDLVLADPYAKQIPLAVDVPFGGATETLLGLSASATINVDLLATFQLSFGIDLSGAPTIVPFLYESTHLALEAGAHTENIAFSANVGPLGLFVKNGELLIDADGDAMTSDRAVLDINLTDNNSSTSDGKIPLASIGLNNATASLHGQLHVTLPVYFPFQSDFKGNLVLTVGDLGDIDDSTMLTLPDLTASSAGENVPLPDRLTSILNGLDMWFPVLIDAFHGKVGNFELPFVGKSMHKVGDFLETVHQKIVQQITDRFAESNEDTDDVLQSALFLALGPSGLNILKDRNFSGTITLEDIGLVTTDTNQDGKIDQVEYTTSLSQALTLLATSIDFDIGLAGLGLDVTGAVKMLVGYDWNLSFGVSDAYGFYILTGQQNEVAINFQARVPDLKARGKLGFLQFDVTDEDADTNPNNDGVDVDMDGRAPSSFVAGLTLDLLDPGDDPQDPADNGKLTGGEIQQLFLGNVDVDQALAVDLVGTADLNLDLMLSFEGDSRFPSIGAQFSIDWAFAGSNSGHGLQGGVPTVAFDHVTLNVGEFITDFAGGILKQVKKFTEPIQPVVDFVTSPIPILEDFGFDLTPLDVAASLGFPVDVRYIQAIADLAAVINSIPNVSAGLTIPLGAFNITTTAGQPIDLRQAVDLSNASAAMPHVTQTVNPVTELHNASASAGGFVDSMTNMGLSIPLLENPASVFQLFLGQTVNLLLYDVPPLSVKFPFPIIMIGPLIPPIPLFATFGGSVGATVDLAVGFDTHGLKKARDTGDWFDVFSGFYVSDTASPLGTGPDVPEATLFGSLDASAEINLAVVGAGVSGGVRLDLNADLIDPNGDKKVHADELLANIPLGVTGTFDLGGKLTAHLEAFVKFFFKKIEFEIANIEIASFDFTPEQIYTDRFSNNNSMAMATSLGAGPGLHLDGLSIENTSDVDWYKFELLRPDSVNVDIRHSGILGDIDLKVYDAAGQLIAEGNSSKDRDIASLVDVAAGDYFVRVAGSGRKNNYALAVEPGSTSSTRVIYVNPAGATDRSVSYFTFAPGSDTFDGLTYRKPKASFTSVLSTYDLGPNDIVVFDTGVHAPGGAIATADSGAIYIGTVAGSAISGISLANSDANRFRRLDILSTTTGLSLTDSDHNSFELVDFSGSGLNVSLDASDHNLFEECTFAGIGDGLLVLGIGGVDDAHDNTIIDCDFRNGGTSVEIQSHAPNLLDSNTFTGTGNIGVHLLPGVTATLEHNDIRGRATGIVWESRQATVLDNDIFENTVGIKTVGGVVGPDNPTPFGAPGGAVVNRVFDNTTGILVAEGSAGAIVRHTDVYGNTVGIEAHGDQTQVVANNVHGNDIGILSDREIGPTSWDANLHNLIHDNETGAVAQAGADVRFNRVYSNAVGVEVVGAATVHHVLIYGNTEDGILVSGARDAKLWNNTIVSPGQSGVHLAGFIVGIDVRNNIVHSTAGYGLRVEAASQPGYTSDYNNYFATGSGGVAFQGKGFDDLYDWQVEAESDLHSLGRTDLAPTLDDPLFVNASVNDYRSLGNSTSIDAGDPTFAFSLEPLTNGNRINLGAYGNTTQATISPAQRLEITAPNFYVDLIPSQSYTIRWDTNNIAAGVNLDIDLLQEGVGKVADVATVLASAGSTNWTPGSFVTGNNTNRYRIRVTTLSGPVLVDQSREPFAIPDFNPANANTFYVNDGSTASDVYTTSIGNNRNTGLTASTPKAVIRPLVLSYPMGASDTVRVDTGNYVHAVNLYLSSAPLAFDPQMNTVTNTAITGPTQPANVARIDRANPNVGSAAIDMINAPSMSLMNMTIVGAGIGVRARSGSTSLSASALSLSDHGQDGLSIETASHNATLDALTAFDNGRNGIYVDSLLNYLRNSTVHDNAFIGIALRSIGAGLVERNEVYNNLRGIDVINPGASTALIGSATLESFLGNRVHHNAVVGIFGSGNTLVAGNTVHENLGTGIRLEDGADATRNVVYQHMIGISARGSTSDITENRSYVNTGTGIEASFSSNVLRNVTYNNGVYGIHGDRFSGVIDHNVVYSTGYASINVEGPGVGAQVTFNTVYEPCDENDFLNVGPTTIKTSWDPTITVTKSSPPPTLSFTTTLSGTVTLEFDDATNPTFGTFDLGPGGGTGALTPAPLPPLPPGESWTINFRVTGMDLSSPSVSNVGIVQARLAQGHLSTGQIFNLQNNGGMLTGNVHLELWIDVPMPQRPTYGTALRQILPVALNYPIGAGFNAFQTLQVPLLIPPTPPPPGFNLINQAQPGEQWKWQLQQASNQHPQPTVPQDRGTTCAEIGILIQNQSSRVLLRQNAVFVEGHALNPPGAPNSLDIRVTADSTVRANYDHNAWMTKYGYVGEFAGVVADDLLAWQTITNQDKHSIAPDVDRAWVDPDGADDTLGGLTTGADDNFHEISPFGQVTQGAQAPIKSTTPGPGLGLPAFQTVIFAATGGTVANLSPLVDAGEPSASFAIEVASAFLPGQHGQMANIGAYGNTSQASRSEPEYIQLVYPIGAEQLVPGRTYLIRWRTHPPLGGTTVGIQLTHGGLGGMVETVIAPLPPGVANTGTFSWTLPAGLPPASDYTIVIARTSTLFPGTNVIGVSPFQFSVGPDTRRPYVLSTTPSIVELSRPTNANVSSIAVQFSEFVANAGVTANYQLRNTGTNLPVAFTVSAPGAPPSNGDPYTVTLNITGGPLAEGSYRLTILSSGINDTVNALDGSLSGSASDYVRDFIIDKTAPTMFVQPVTPNPRNNGVNPLSLVFNEAVTGVGLADVRLTLSGGPNLLSGSQGFSSTDGQNWQLANVTGLVFDEGTFELNLTAANSNIRDLAGNALVLNDSTTWVLDGTPPTVDIVDVSPNPRSTSVSQATLVFSEPVLNVSLSDLHLFRDGVEIALAAPNAPTTSDSIMWSVSNLASLTAAAGSYLLKVGVGGTLRDVAGNGLAAEGRETWQVIIAPPVADIVDASPDPRIDSISDIIVSFNVPITGLDLGDLRLTRGGNVLSLAGLQQPTSLDQMNWHLTGLAPLTAANGDYVFSLIAAGSGIQDLAGNALAANASDAWVRDDVHPTVSITPISPDPTNISVDQITLTFSKPVTGLNLANLVLTRGGSIVAWTEDQSVTTTDGVIWKLNNASPLTAPDGVYVLTLNPSTNLVEAFPGNPLVVGASETWLFDSTSPTVAITDVTPNAAFVPTNTVEIVFGEPVTDFDKSDLVLTHRGVVLLLTGSQPLTSADNQTWTLSNIASLTNEPGKYELSVRAVGSGIHDAAANSLIVGNFETWRVLIPGDYNQDGIVDAADYVVWRKFLGTTGVTAYTGADGDGDSTIDQDDHGVWRAHYGETLPPPGSGSGAVAASSPSTPGEVPQESVSALVATQTSAGPETLSEISSISAPPMANSPAEAAFETVVTAESLPSVTAPQETIRTGGQSAAFEATDEQSLAAQDKALGSFRPSVSFATKRQIDTGPRETRSARAVFAPTASFLPGRETDIVPHRTQRSLAASREIWTELDFDKLLLSPTARSIDDGSDLESAPVRIGRGHELMTHAAALDNVFSDLGTNSCRLHSAKTPMAVV